MKYVIETMQAKVEECDKDRDNFLLNAKHLFKVSIDFWIVEAKF